MNKLNPNIFNANTNNLLSKALMKADFPTLAEPCKIKDLVNSDLGSTGDKLTDQRKEFYIYTPTHTQENISSVSHMRYKCQTILQQWELKFRLAHFTIEREK